MAQLQSTAVTGSLGITGSVLTLPSFTNAQTGSLTGSIGQWWFNSTSNKLNFTVEGPLQSNTWSTGGALITGRCSGAGAGTQNAGLLAGGRTFQIVGDTEEYNGTSWATGGALITARQNLAGAGTQSAGLAFGGNNGVTPFAASCTEEYNGTSWATGGALITARISLAGAGTQNAGLAFGGYRSGVGNFTCTEEYNPGIRPIIVCSL